MFYESFIKYFLELAAIVRHNSFLLNLTSCYNRWIERALNNFVIRIWMKLISNCHFPMHFHFWVLIIPN